MAARRTVSSASLLLWCGTAAAKHLLSQRAASCIAVSGDVGLASEAGDQARDPRSRRRLLCHCRSGKPANLAGQWIRLLEQVPRCPRAAGYPLRLRPRLAMRFALPVGGALRPCMCGGGCGCVADPPLLPGAPSGRRGGLGVGAALADRFGNQRPARFPAQPALGEFTALTALGVFSPETALNLTFKRGLLMEQACDGAPRGNRKLYACSPQRANLSDDSETADRVFFALLEEVAQSLAHTSSFVEVVNNNIRHQQYVVAGDLVGLAVLGKCLDPQYRANCASGEDVESLVSHALTSVRIDNRDGVARDPNIAHDVDFATSSAQKYGSRSTFRRFIKGADDGFTPSLDELTHLTLEEDGRSGLKKKSWFVPLIMEVPFHSSKLRRAMDAFLPVLRTALPDEAALRELLSISKDGILDEERRVHPLWITNLTGRVFDPLNRAFQQSALECMKRANIGEIRHKGRFESTLVVDTFNSGAAEGNVREMTAANYREEAEEIADFIWKLSTDQPMYTFPDLWAMFTAKAMARLGGPNVVPLRGRDDPPEFMTRDLLLAFPRSLVHEDDRDVLNMKRVLSRQGFSLEQVVALIGCNRCIGFHDAANFHTREEVKPKMKRRPGAIGPSDDEFHLPGTIQKTTMDPYVFGSEYFNLLLDYKWRQPGLFQQRRKGAYSCNAKERARQVTLLDPFSEKSYESQQRRMGPAEKARESSNATDKRIPATLGDGDSAPDRGRFDRSGEAQFIPGAHSANRSDSAESSNREPDIAGDPDYEAERGTVSVDPCEHVSMRGVDVMLLDDALTKGWLYQFGDNELEFYAAVSEVILNIQGRGYNPNKLATWK
ncbi:Peroxidase family protein [Leishmania donovani]|uniref:Peroxidase family protein n=1 Tax=Leishmania donovani TaxID=5661 RepID=A0A504XEL9_LEIDO|nr:Peroxidase family protein [Leishmania donovani]